MTEKNKKARHFPRIEKYRNREELILNEISEIFTGTDTCGGSHNGSADYRDSCVCVRERDSEGV
jgi:hypothetical protein